MEAVITGNHQMDTGAPYTKIKYDLETRIWGGIIVASTFCTFSFLIYAIVVSKLVPDTNNKVAFVF